MTKREKIILVLMALTVVYGFYALFIEPSSKVSQLATTASGSKLDSVNAFISKIAAMTKGGLSQIDSYVIEHVPAKWTKDPLLNTSRDFEFRAEKPQNDIDAKQLGITYSGFLQMGAKNLAIINGFEYEAGEKLLDSGHTVAQIDPNRVVLVLQGAQRRLIVPIEDAQ
jgi:hypothetical protein